jgi:hypothetical protein
MNSLLLRLFSAGGLPRRYVCPLPAQIPSPPQPPPRRKKEAREAHRRSRFAQKVHGLRAKLYNAKRYKEKATMRKT